jgi:hypothetical protein
LELDSQKAEYHPFEVLPAYPLLKVVLSATLLYDRENSFSPLATLSR